MHQVSDLQQCDGQAALEAAGMTTKDEPPKQGNGKLDLETFKRAISQMTDGPSLMKWFAGERKKLNMEDMAAASKLVNDRLLTLIKKAEKV